MNVLSIVVFHNNVVYDETVFQVKLNISVVSVVRVVNISVVRAVMIKQFSGVILIINVVSVVNDEIIFNVILCKSL